MQQPEAVYSFPNQGTTFYPNGMQHASFSPLKGSYPAAPNVPGYHLLLEEAREIRYKGRDLLYIFYYNQITNLLSRCPDPSKRMNLLRDSCQDEAR